MRYTKKQVEARIGWLNELTGEKYQTTQTANGWDLFIKLPSGGESRGYFGFDDRKSTSEFMQYLYGCCCGLTYNRK